MAETMTLGEGTKKIVKIALKPFSWLSRGRLEITVYLLLTAFWLAHRASQSASNDYVFPLNNEKYVWQLIFGTVVYWLIIGVLYAFSKFYRQGISRNKTLFPGQPHDGIPIVAEGLRRRARFLTIASYGVLLCILAVLWYGYGVFSEAEQRTNQYVLERNQRLITRYTNAIAVSEELKLQLDEHRRAKNTLGVESFRITPLPCWKDQERRDCDTVSDDVIKLCNLACAQREYMRFKEIAQAYKAQATEKNAEKNIESVMLGMTTKIGSVALLFFSIFLLVSLYRYTSRLSIFYHSRADLLHLFAPNDTEALEKFATTYVPDWVEFGKGSDSVYERVFNDLFPQGLASRMGFGRNKKATAKEGD